MIHGRKIYFFYKAIYCVTFLRSGGVNQIQKIYHYGKDI